LKALIRLSLESGSGDWIWRKKDYGEVSLFQSMGLEEVLILNAITIVISAW